MEVIAVNMISTSMVAKLVIIAYGRFWIIVKPALKFAMFSRVLVAIDSRILAARNPSMAPHSTVPIVPMLIFIRMISMKPNTAPMTMNASTASIHELSVLMKFRRCIMVIASAINIASLRSPMSGREDMKVAIMLLGFHLIKACTKCGGDMARGRGSSIWFKNTMIGVNFL